MSAPLSKKQQKALAFRSKQKAKKYGKEEIVPDDVPEQDLVDDDAAEPEENAVVVKPEGSKKRKRATEGAENGTISEDVVKGEDVEAAGSGKGAVTGKGKGKGKAKTAWDDDEEAGEEDKDGKKGKKDVKQRFILFVGNLDYKTTQQDVQQHFKPAVEKTPSVRLLTAKATIPGRPPKSRGIAFLELPTSSDLQACLKLHHSILQNRRINVELTAGGGGKGDKRKVKIKERNDRVGGQRERKKEREAEEGGGGELAEAETEGSSAAKKPRGEAGDGSGGTEDGVRRGKVEVVQDGDGAVKIRNGRRVRVGPKSGEQQAAKRPNAMTPAGRADQRPPQRGNWRKFEPTGANAVNVG